MTLSACVTEISGRSLDFAYSVGYEFAYNINILKKRTPELVTGLSHGRERGRQSIKTPYEKNI